MAWPMLNSSGSRSVGRWTWDTMPATPTRMPGTQGGKSRIIATWTTSEASKLSLWATRRGRPWEREGRAVRGGAGGGGGGGGGGRAGGGGRGEPARGAHPADTLRSNDGHEERATDGDG